MTATRLLPLLLLLLGCSGSTDAGSSADAGASTEATPEPPTSEVPKPSPAPTPRINEADKSDLPRDAAGYLTGSLLRGTVRDGETGKALAGCTVSEHGVNAKPVHTKGDGVFELSLANELRPAVLAECNGYVSTLQIASEQSRSFFEGEFKIELFTRAEEDAAFLEDTGQARSADKALVMLSIRPLRLAAGVQATLAAEGATGWVYGPGDKPTKGDTFGADAGTGEIAYPELAPASAYTVTVNAPEPLKCAGPLELPALADTITWAHYLCSFPGDAARRPKAK